MKKYLFLFITVLFGFLQANAQSLAFKKLYSTNGPSNQASGIVQLSNGDFIVTGIRSVPMGGSQYIANIFMFRIHSNGDTVWTKEIGTATDRELANGMTQLPNGNIVILGNVNLPPNGLSDAFAVCTDTAGNVLWQKRFGGAGSDRLTDAAFDGQNIVISGVTDSYGAGADDVWLVKMTPAGDTVWTKTFGGTLVDDAWGIQVAYDAYYLIGSTYSYANGQNDDVLLIKTDTAGNEIWHKNYGVKDKVDVAWGITTSYTSGAVDGLVFTGVKDTEPSQPNASYGSMFLAKVDTAGTIVWDKSISAPSNPNWRREGFDIKRFNDGGYIISGLKLEPSVQSQQLYVVKTDDAGVVLWDTAFGTSDSNYYANAVAISNDGGWAVTGSVFNIPQQMRYMYVAKFNPNNVSVTQLDAEDDINIYPNPAKGNLVYVNSNTGLINMITIHSIDGRMLYNKEYLNNQTGCSVPINNEGVFIISVYTDKGITRKKVLSVK